MAAAAAKSCYKQFVHASFLDNFISIEKYSKYNLQKYPASAEVGLSRKGLGLKVLRALQVLCSLYPDLIQDPDRQPIFHFFFIYNLKVIVHRF